jgi:hypothetical protein
VKTASTVRPNSGRSEGSGERKFPVPYSSCPTASSRDVPHLDDEPSLEFLTRVLGTFVKSPEQACDIVDISSYNEADTHMRIDAFTQMPENSRHIALDK